MTIITHRSLKEPLEKRVTFLIQRFMALIHLVFPMLVPQLTVYRRRVRAAWLALNGREAYRVARYLPDEESIDWQCRMSAALGHSDRAVIVVQLIRWSDFNKKEGRPATTHNGYDDWIARHFWHLKPGAFGGHIRALEAMGVLKTERIGRSTPQGPYDQRKSYRVDHVRLNALLAAVKAPVSDTDVQESKPKTRNSKMKTVDPSLNNDSNSGTQSSDSNAVPNPGTQPPTKPAGRGRGGPRPGAGRKKKHPVTEAPASTAAPGSADKTALEAKQGAAQTPDPSPRSEAPSSHADHPEADLIERMIHLSPDRDKTFESGKAMALIDEYGADRVRAVVRKCQQRMRPDSREQPIDRPAGWVVGELRNDTFKLGTMTLDEWWALPENMWQRLSAQSLSLDELKEMAADADSATDAQPDEIDAEADDGPVGDMPAAAAIPDDTPAPEILVVMPVPAVETAESAAIAPSQSTLLDHRTVWDRAMRELSGHCNQVAAQIIREQVTVVDYAAETVTFSVQAKTDHALKTLRLHAGIVEPLLGRIAGHPCRIKHNDQPGQTAGSK